MFCPNCGNQIKGNASFCSNCGWSKKSDVSKKGILKIPKMQKVVLKTMIAVIGIVIFGLIIYNVSNPKGKVYEFNKINKVKSIMEYAKDKDFKDFKVDRFDTVKFGMYPQSDENGNNREPIEWIVLERQGEKVLLLSKYIIDCKCYNDELKYVTWENCTLRNWLNNDFYNTAFSSSEQNKILTTNIVNSDNSVCGTNGGNDTNDKMFCLSIEEIMRYFGNGTKEDYGYQLGKKVVTRGTNYAKAIDNGGLYVEDGNSKYWLRSPGRDQRYAAYVDYYFDSYGYLDRFGSVVDYRGCGGVRPALWVSY